MRVLVCGGRNYNDTDRIFNTLYKIDAHRGPITCIIHGCATGADTQGRIWAEHHGRKHVPFRPDWSAHGKAAGPLRNARMLTEGKPDLVVAFPGGRGTDDMKNRARCAGIEIIEII